MRKINNLEDLIKERERLTVRKEFLEGEIKNSFHEIKTSLEPLNALRKGASHLLSSKNNDVLSNTVGGAIEFILRNFILKRSGLITRLLVPYLVKNATAGFVNENKTGIINTISTLISAIAKRKSKKEKPETGVFDRTTVSDEIY